MQWQGDLVAILKSEKPSASISLSGRLMCLPAAATGSMITQMAHASSTLEQGGSWVGTGCRDVNADR
jgi:hypothetical protein